MPDYDNYQDNDPLQEEDYGLDQNQLNEEENSPAPLSRNQKIAVGTLSVFACFIIILWLVQLNNNIRSPFAYQANQTQTGTSTLGTASGSSNAVSDEALKNQDTDNDGISDWDELNIYNTSPYLEDSDGDGINDYQEVKNGTNPNCPEGQTCSETNFQTTASSSSPDNQDSISSLMNNNTSQVLPNTASSSSAADQTILQNVMSGQVDAATLRQLLIQAGMDKNQLDQISDADLLKAYQDTLNSQ